MPILQREGLRELRFRTKQRLGRGRIGLAWIPLILFGMVITKLNVTSTPPPVELFKAALPPIEVVEPGTERPDGFDTETAGQSTAQQDSELGVNTQKHTQRVARYADVEMSEEELYELVCVVYLESGTQSLRGQQAVAEVILNRVIAGNFPDTVHDVIFQGMESEATLQLSTAPHIGEATPGEDQYLAVEQALYGPSVLPADVVFFSIEGENEYVWGSIEDHVFCYQYPWAVA